MTKDVYLWVGHWSFVFGQKFLQSHGSQNVIENTMSLTRNLEHTRCSEC